MSRTMELKTALAEKVAFINEGIDKGVTIEGKTAHISEDSADAIRQAYADASEIKALLDAESFAGEMKAWMDTPAGDASAAVRANAQDFRVRPDIKSLGQSFIESAEFKSLRESGGATMPQAFSAEVFDVTQYGERKDIYSAVGAHNVSRGIGTQVQFDPMVPRGQRTTRVRDLFPKATTSSNLIDFFRVTGFAEGSGAGNAATVADYSGGNFGLKPKSTLQFNSDQAPVRTIAHWEAAHRNAIADEPALQATIDNELLYGLQLQEDFQILSGDGLNENLRGILNTPAIQTYSQIAPDEKSDALRRSITKAVIAYYPPSGIVLHPNDWEDIELQKGTDGQYMFAINVAVGAAAQVWRLPVVETPAIAEGTWLLGAFGYGAQLYDRQLANVRIAEQHADFFVRNAIAILAEERIALAVKRPESFVKGTFL